MRIIFPSVETDNFLSEWKERANTLHMQSEKKKKKKNQIR